MNKLGVNLNGRQTIHMKTNKKAAASELIGKRLEVEVTSHTVKIGGKEVQYKTVHLLDERAAMKFVEQYIGERSYRIRIPGYMYTCDHKPNRVNIHIDGEGFIIGITYG